MITLAKITAVIIIIAGLLVMLGGAIVGITGAARMGMMQPFNGFPGGPMMPGIPQAIGVGIGLLFGGVVFIQGLMMAAMGEALYLISAIARGSSTRPI